MHIPVTAFLIDARSDKMMGVDIYFVSVNHKDETPHVLLLVLTLIVITVVPLQHYIATYVC